MIDKIHTMKRSKLFLIVTTIILTVIGVAAAKRFTGTTRYYLTSHGAFCVPDPAILCRFYVHGSFICRTNLSGPSRPLFTVGPSGVIGSSNRCTNILFYSSTGE